MMPSPAKRLPWAVRLATHLYHLLIRIGPEEFLQEYEEYMLSDFRRHCHEVYKRQGMWGLLRECSPMFPKAVVDMSEERASCQKKKTVPSTTSDIVFIMLKIVLLEVKVVRAFTGRKFTSSIEEDLIQRMKVILGKGGIK